MVHLKKSATRLSSMFHSQDPAQDRSRELPPAAADARIPPKPRMSPAPAMPAIPPAHASQPHSRVSSVASTYSNVSYQPPPPLPPRGEENRLSVATLSANLDPNAELLPPPPLSGSTYSPRSPAGSRSSSPVRSARPSAEQSRPNTPNSSWPLANPQHQHQHQHQHQTWQAPSPVSTAAPVFGEGGQAEEPKKRKWLKKSMPKNELNQRPPAWVIGHEGRPPYNLSNLLHGQQVPELWDERGDTLVYLFPRTSNKGASFRVSSSIFSSSPVLVRLAHGQVYSHPGPPGDRRQRHPPEQAMRNLSLGSIATPPISPDLRGAETESSTSSKGSRVMSEQFDLGPSEIHLYVPLSLSTDNAAPGPKGQEQQPNATDVDTLVAVRNLFGFLMGQSLVATERRPTIFSIFLRIAELLQLYEFSNADGSSRGEVATASFDGYVEELHIADVRMSREKTIEGLVLAEQMRSPLLYNEAFTHAAGKYDDIGKLSSAKYQFVSATTQSRLERASMDLSARIKSIETRLVDFEFPAIFAGIMNSKTAEEGKMVRFDAWKSAFMSTRKYFLGYYKHRYGNWPPKASSKKNELETSGLNRIVLRELYNDMAALYDLLVDRTSLTTRTIDGVGHGGDDEEAQEPVARALRAVLSEYDRSSPPVQPPVPFDVPLLPTLAATRKDYGIGDEKKDAKARIKKLKSDEVAAVLRSSHNRDTAATPPVFLDAFRELEAKAAHGRTIEELVDLRAGQWLFMYAVLQSLPMLVVDSPSARWTRGVEYFLCAPPRQGMPWARDDAAAQRSWYGVAGGAGVVSLPAELIEHGVEGIYRRSHCWLAAERWAPAAIGPPAQPPPPPQQQQQQQPFHSHPHSSPHIPHHPPPATGNSIHHPSPGPHFGFPPPSFPPDYSSARPHSTADLPLLPPHPPASSPPTIRGGRDSVMYSGLEALPLPAGVRPASSAGPGGAGFGPVPGPGMEGVGGRKPAVQDPSKTFDAILGSVEGAGEQKRGRWKKR